MSSVWLKERLGTESLYDKYFQVLLGVAATASLKRSRMVCAAVVQQSPKLL
jgi:hypothetical protein